MTRNRLSRVALFLAGATLCAFGLVATNPLRLPDTVIRAWLQHNTPPGSRSADVRAWLESRRWLDRGHHENAGLYWQDPGMLPAIIGTSSLAAHLGHYRGIPWRVDVEAGWAFDEQDRLIAVKVRKDADSL